MPQINLNVGPELFRFATYSTWIAWGASWFRSRNQGLRSRDIVCIDALGRICRIGRDFARAENDGAFPVIAYRSEPE